MPIYVFACEEHGNFEVRFAHVSREREQPCPKCKKVSLKTVAAPNMAVGNSTYNVPKQIDLTVGKAAEKAWRSHDDRVSKRKKN